MAVADIYRVTRQGKGMHKRQILRLLTAAPRGNNLVQIVEVGVSGRPVVTTITQTDAINDLTSDILGGEFTRPSLRDEDRFGWLTDDQTQDSREEEVNDAIVGGGDRFFAE